MRFSRADRQSRREFFRAAARYGLLTGLGAAVVAAARVGRDQICVRQRFCERCGRLATCGLPEAVVFRGMEQRASSRLGKT